MKTKSVFHVYDCVQQILDNKLNKYSSNLKNNLTAKKHFSGFLQLKPLLSLTDYVTFNLFCLISVCFPFL